MTAHTHYLSREMITEMYYKQMMALYVPGWLPHRDYSPLIPFVKYDGHKGDTMRFFVPNKYNGWNTYFQFVEWDEVVADREYKPFDSARLLLYGANMRVHCPCPSYQFWGHNYVMTQKDAAIVPEERFPTIRNPNLKGGLCKHLARTAMVLPFHLNELARSIKEARKAIDSGRKQ